MNRRKAGRALVVLAILFVAALTACRPEAEQGWLMGQVTIGPLQPVAEIGVPEPTPDPEVYTARQIVVFDPDSGAEVLRAGLDTNGQYRVALPAGIYTVDINHAGIDSAAGLPATVEIYPNQATQLDVAIDTGIR